MKNSSQTIYLVALLSLMILIPGCNQAQKPSTDKQTEANIEEELINSQKALTLLSSVCYACHNPASASHDEMLAPPLAGIKMRYLKATENRDAFIKRMTTYVSNPTEELALMKGPIKRFGIMPKTALSESEIQSIVTYIYDNELPAPEWFADHERQMKGNK